MRRTQDASLPADSPKPPRAITNEDRRRVRGLASLVLGSVVVAIAALGALAIWHLVRRGRLIRQRLEPPRAIRPLEDAVPPRNEAVPSDD